MSVSLTPNEQGQLTQTIEMFEVITESQPLDYQSLEILKEAYLKLDRQTEAVRTSKRIAEAYLALGQLSSAILEYESILQRFPDDPDVQQSLTEIERKASNVAPPKPSFEAPPKPVTGLGGVARKADKTPGSASAELEDGREAMQKLYVDGKLISAADFNQCWPNVQRSDAPKQPNEAFIQILAERQFVPLETSLKLLVEKARCCYLPIERYDVDVDLARSFPRDLCQRWCVLPFDRMSKSILIATANPFNKEVCRQLEEFTRSRVVWFISSPVEIAKMLRKVFR